MKGGKTKMFKKKKKKVDEVKKVVFDEEEDFENGEDEVEEPEEEEVPTPTRRTKQKVMPPQMLEKSGVWVVQEIPIQSEKVLYNNKSKKALDLYSAIAEILNRTEEEE